MGTHTEIAWTDHTFNPWWGCARVSAGCQHCYAESFAKRTGHDVWGAGGDRRMLSDNNWNQPLRWNQAAEKAGVRQRVFCASMADVFEDHPAVVDSRLRLFDLIAETPWLDWQLLTKRPENVLQLIPTDWYTAPSASRAGTIWPTTMWPDNVWIGTTVENQAAADVRIPILLQLPAPVRFLSCEPLLGPIDLGSWLHCGHTTGVTALRSRHRRPARYQCDQCGRECNAVQDPDGPIRGSISNWRYDVVRPYGIDWVIIGGESGPGFRAMNPDDAHQLFDQLDARIPVFFKQWGGIKPTSGGHVIREREVRQFPTVTAL